MTAIGNFHQVHDATIHRPQNQRFWLVLFAMKHAEILNRVWQFVRDPLRRAPGAHRREFLFYQRLRRRG